MSDTPERPGDEAGADEAAFEERSISQVGGPSRGNSVLVVIFGVAIIGLLLWVVNRSDDSNTEPRLTAAEDLEFNPAPRRDAPEFAVPEQPAAQTTSAPEPPNPFQLELQRLALRQAEEQRLLAEQRRRAPILIVDQRSTAASFSSRPTSSVVNGAIAPTSSNSASNNLAAELSAATPDTVSAQYIKNKSYTIAQGALIRGVLETAIQSDLPGFVRAEVSHDVYSFDGSRLLIPKASRLIGQYRSGLVRGQTRVFVIWDRLLRPDGASILIGSPSADLLGRSGLKGDLDTHFLKIFGSSVLLSLLDGAIAVAVERARDTSDSSSTTILQDSSSLNRAAEIALENSINIPPTIHVDQGTAIQVFVARDLNFQNVSGQ